MQPRVLVNRRLSRLALVLSLFAPLLAGVVPSTSPSASAQEGAVELYQATQFDYFFFYDAARWQIVDQSSEAGEEFASLSDGETYVDYWALEAPNTTAADCLNDFLDGLYEDPAIIEIAALTDEGGAPEIDDFGSRAATELVVTAGDGANGRFKLATELRCQELEPGQSVLFTSVYMPAAVWNDKQSFADPWITGYLPIHATREEGAPVAIPDDLGDLNWTLDAALACAGDTFSVIARNYDVGGSFVIDPASFAMVSETGEYTQATLDAWISPSISPESSLVLEPGEIGLFRLHSSGSGNDLYYSPPDSAPVYLGTHTICSAAAAVNSPVLIDLED